MNFLQIIALLNAVLPAGATAVLQVEGFVQKGDWTGLVGYLETLVGQIPALQHAIDALKNKA